MGKGQSSIKASDLLVKCLENEGVEFIFGIPGEENLDFLDSLKDSGIKFILTRHEQGAGFMAATYGRLTGKPGVCLSTLGPGATNLVTPAAYSQLGGMPMIIITGQKPIKKSKQGRFQILDVVDMMRPLTKYSKQIVNGNTIPSIVRDSFKIAIEERPGAVHLELPEDIAGEDTFADVIPVNKVRRPEAEEKAIKRAVQMIQDATQPLVLIGAGANRKRTSSALLKFIKKTGIPFFNTQMGKGVIDERHPLFLGTAALSDSDYIHCAIDRADLIINVGHDVIEKPPFYMSMNANSGTAAVTGADTNEEKKKNGKKVIHVNFSPSPVDQIYFPQLDVIGDIASAVEHLTMHVDSQNHWDFNYFKNLKKEIDIQIFDRAEELTFPILPQFLVAETRRVMPPNGIVTLDNGIYKIWFARNYLAYSSNTLLMDNALATMGAGLPSAIGAKMVFPNRKVMAVCGDGGFMMNSQELETAVRLGLDLLVVILRDDAYGMIKWKQEAMGFESFGLDYQNPDFVRYAESYGAFGHRIEEASELGHMLSFCLSQKGVHVIEVPVDYSENYKVLIERLKSKTCTFF
jgi:acetolactate synthase-1/2/3 large subunit